MNRVILIGRMTKDPEIRYAQGENTLAIGRFTIACDRKIKREGEATADFISCIAFGKQAEFLERYCTKGTKLVVEGRITTGSYTNKDGQKVYTTDVVVENCEFAESKNASQSNNNQPQVAPAPSNADGFMNIPSSLDGEEVPFL